MVRARRDRRPVPSLRSRMFVLGRRQDRETGRTDLYLSHSRLLVVFFLVLASSLVGRAEPAEARGKSRGGEVESAAAAPAVDPARLETLAWREVGPYRGGRSAAATGIPTQPLVYYFGATGGGVWKTTDGGQRWNNVSDGYFGGSIGAVAVSEWDPNVIYVGGGEKTVRGNVSHGDGVWKSTDAGKTWSHIGLADSRHIPRIRIDPRDPDRVYVAALGHLFGPNDERGIFRSLDGGASWEKVLFVDQHTGAVDLALDPTNPRILYATFWRVLRTPFSLESGGEGSGIYKSTDGGTTWELLSTNPGMPEPPLGIAGITVSPSDPENLYAIVEAKDGGVFRSRDGGATWERTNSERNLRQRAWYYTRIVADPADAESVYVLNVRFHHSKDGGKTFRQIPTPHGDNHDLWIDPGNSLRMIEANDGGANVSTDGGETWTAQDNQPTAQMYRVSVDNAFPYRLLGGQQDNSAIRIRSRSAFGSAIGTRDWEPTAGGESGHIAAKPDDPDVVVGGSYGGFLTLVDHRTGERRAINVWPDNPMGWGAAELRYRFQWNFPLQWSRHDPNRLFAAANVLFASDDLGTTWTALSDDLTRNDASKMGSSGGPITQDNTSVEYYGTIFALAESPHEAGVLWAGSDDGLVHLTRDGGATWTDVTPPDLPEWAQVNGLDPHPFEPGGVYLAATRYKLDDFEPYLYTTSDWGATWRRIDDGIDRQHFTRALRADPEQPGLLYAGTERGVMVSFDDGERWQSLSAGPQIELPIVPVTDLAVKEGDLVAATQGRGYWILDDLNLLRQLAAAEAAGNEALELYVPEPTYRLSGGRRDDPGLRGTNPPAGVVFHFWVDEGLMAEDSGEGGDADDPAEDSEETEKTFEATLEIRDAEGELVRCFTRKPAEGGGGDAVHHGDDPRQLEIAAGMNRFEWDLRHPSAEGFPGLVLWNRRLTGPRAIPGTYTANLTIGESTASASFEVLADPRSSASQDDYRAQRDFLQSVGAKLTETHRALRRLRSAKEQLKGLEGRLGDEHDAVRESSKTLRETLEAHEKVLYQTRNQSAQDPLNFPIRLNDKLSGLLGLAGFGDKAPTAAMMAVRDELVAAIDVELAAIEKALGEDLAAVEALVREHGVPAIGLPTDGEAAER